MGKTTKFGVVVIKKFFMSMLEWLPFSTRGNQTAATAYLNVATSVKVFARFFVLQFRYTCASCSHAVDCV